MTLKPPAHAALILVHFAALGCSRPETVEVSGTVTWEGAPIPHGDIVFFALNPHIAASAGKIVDGEYRFRCKPGEKRVEIQSYRLSSMKTPAGKLIGEMYIPDRYNTNSTLTAEVKIDGENQFNFNLRP